MRILGIGNGTNHPRQATAAAPAPRPVDVRGLRVCLGMSQAGFAHRFGFPLRSLRRWESGAETPQGPALALLNLIERNPQIVVMALHPPVAR